MTSGSSGEEKALAEVYTRILTIRTVKVLYDLRKARSFPDENDNLMDGI